MYDMYLVKPRLIWLVVLALMSDQVYASKTNDISSRDIVGWTERQVTQHKLSSRQHPMTMDELKEEVRREKQLRASRRCAERALHLCDITSLAKLLQAEDTACTLLEEYKTCIYRETEGCTVGDARLLTTSLDSLLIGLKSNGHCGAITTHTSPESILSVSRPNHPCGRRGVWMCTSVLVDDLQSLDHSVCTTMTNYRHCIHVGTQPCARKKSDALLRGTRGLARLYRRLLKDC